MYSKERFIKELCSLNNARKGSFGEYIFSNYFKTIKGKNIKHLHEKRVDYEIDGELYDVKTTTRHINKINVPPWEWNNKGVIEGIKYPIVDFTSEKVCIYIDRSELTSFTYDEVIHLYKEWREGRKKYYDFTSNTIKQKLNYYKKDLKIYFCNLGVNVRVIGRTVEKLFGGKTGRDTSPGNLIPIKIEKDRMTIFVNFKSFNISDDDIEYIIAYKESEYMNFSNIVHSMSPLKDRVTFTSFPEEHNQLYFAHENYCRFDRYINLKGGKTLDIRKEGFIPLFKKELADYKKKYVDLGRVPEKYVFKNIDDLKINYQRLLKEN